MLYVLCFVAGLVTTPIGLLLLALSSADARERGEVPQYRPPTTGARI